MTLYTVRPLTDFTWLTGEEQLSPFSASWSSTLDLLRRELEQLDATDVVLELNVRAGQVRRDGMLRSDAKVDGGAVRLSFQSKHGQQTHALDKYVARYSNDPEDWQQNLRAIALTLEALRAVDRYGSAWGQQYAGYAALVAAKAMPASHMTSDEAQTVLRSVVGAFDYSTGAERFRRARAMAHPDRHDGDRTLWDQVEAAGKTLGLLA